MNAGKRFAAILLAACIAGAAAAAAAEEPASMTDTQARATFAGGCFWCMQSEFDDLDGIVSTAVGYTGGSVPNPTYQHVSAGSTGHAEAIEIVYDPAKVRYEQLLDIFWTNIDPTQLDGQFVDVGSQYRTGIFYHDETQRRLAEESKAALQSSGKFTKPIVTDIVPAAVFYPAEEYHQRYYKKNPMRYKMYKIGSGREGFIKRTWGR